MNGCKFKLLQIKKSIINFAVVYNYNSIKDWNVDHENYT